MRGFVVIATARRGRVFPPERVSEDCALWLNESMHREVFSDTVVWQKGFSALLEQPRRVEKMLRLARRAG